jgi:hypothetical protein
MTDPVITPTVITEAAQVRKKQLEQQSSRLDSYMHALIVMTILLSATALRVAHDLDTQTISTVYGAALGYATGLTISRRSSNGA